jgi:hypothetical protein
LSASIGLPVAAFGVVYFNEWSFAPIVIGAGMLWTLMSLFGWVLEPGTAEE